MRVRDPELRSKFAYIGRKRCWVGFLFRRYCRESAVIVVLNYFERLDGNVIGGIFKLLLAKEVVFDGGLLLLLLNFDLFSY